LITLAVAPTAILADVLAALGERLGGAFLIHVLDRAGNKHRHCRIFVDGYPADDLNACVNARAEPAEIEIILLVAPEGG
jgi:hypothetical protein